MMTLDEAIQHCKEKADCIDIIAKSFEASARFESKIAKLVYLSGKSLDEIIELYAAGYTLQPPKQNKSLESYIEERERNDR